MFWRLCAQGYRCQGKPERARDLQKLELQVVVSHPMWVLRIELESLKEQTTLSHLFSSLLHFFPLLDVYLSLEIARSTMAGSTPVPAVPAYTVHLTHTLFQAAEVDVS